MNNTLFINFSIFPTNKTNKHKPKQTMEYLELYRVYTEITQTNCSKKGHGILFAS